MFTEPMMLTEGASGGTVSVTLFALEGGDVASYYLDPEGSQPLDHALGENLDLTLLWIGGAPHIPSYLRDDSSGYLLMANVKRLSVDDPELFLRLGDLTGLESYVNHSVTTFSRLVTDQGLRPGNTGASECEYTFPELLAIQQTYSGQGFSGFVVGAGSQGASPPSYSMINFPALSAWTRGGAYSAPMISDCFGVVRMNFGAAVNFQNVYVGAGGLPGWLIVDFSMVDNYPLPGSGGVRIAFILRQNGVAAPPSQFDGDWYFFVPDTLLSAYISDSAWTARGLMGQIFPFSDFDDIIGDPRVTI